MRDLAVLFIHLIATVARLPGGQVNVVNPFQQDNHAREQNDQLLNNSHFFGQTGLGAWAHDSTCGTNFRRATIAFGGNMSHVCYIFPLMPDDKRLLELALKGLEAERSRIDEEINELKSMQGVGNERTLRKTRSGSITGHALTGSKPKRKGTLTAAGRKKLSEAAKRRWAANRKTGKTTL